MNGLAFIALPLPEESSVSLLKRTALKNGYRSIDKFLSFHFPNMAASYQSLRQDSALIEELSNLAGEYAETLKTGFYKASHRILERPDLTINDIKVSKRLIRFREAAICSECCSDGWEKFIRDFSLADYCPYHFRKYLSACPECQRKFTWLNQTTTKCKCGQIIISPRCSEIEAEPEMKLLDLLRAKSQNSFDLFFNTFQNLCIGSSTHDRPLRRRIFSAALAIALEDRKNITLSLHNLFQNTNTINNKLIIAKLSNLTPPHIKSFILNQPPNNASVSEYPSYLNFLLTTQQLLTHLEINNKQWTSIRKHPLFPKKNGATSAYTLPEIAVISDIAKLAAEEHKLSASGNIPQESITLSCAANTLKIDPHILRELIASGLLGKKTTPTNAPHTVSAADVRNFDHRYICIQRIAKETSTTTNTIRKKIIDLAICTIPLANGFKITTVISRESAEEIIKSIISPKAEKRKKWHKYSANLPTIGEGKREDYYSTSEASTLLGFDKSTIRKLSRKGILNANYKAKFGEYLIPKNDIECFNEKYITISEASRTLLYPRNKATKILASQGVLPVIGTIAKNCSITLFSRSDIQKLITTDDRTPYKIFHEEHRSNNLIKFSEACLLTDITRTSLSIISRRVTIPFRPEHYQSVKGFSSFEIKKIQSYLHDLTPLSKLLDTYNISHISFSKLFLISKYIEHININGTPYLEPKEKNKAVSILEKLCTCKQADSTLGAPPNFTRNLINSGKIKPVNPPHGIPSSPTLLNKEFVLKFKLQTAK